MAEPLQIGLVLFPKVTQLDFTGPLQVFAALPSAKVHLVWKRIEPVPSDSVMMLTPTTSFADCPQLDVICVPGGFGTNDMVNDEEMLAFSASRRRCRHLGLHGIAGAGRGRAVARLSRRDALDRNGISGKVRRHPTKTRVCVDHNRITGGGVTAGIDFALTLVSLLSDRKTAEGDPARHRI